MLPIEAFADAIAFLRLYDLNALVVANALCSSLAVKASKMIRWEEFPGLRLEIANEGITIFRASYAPEDEDGQFVAYLSFPSENDVIDFIAAAFPNCIFEDVDLSGFANERLLDAIGRVAGSVVVSQVLRTPLNINFEGMDFRVDMLDPIQRFRKVKSLYLTTSIHGGEIEELVNFCRGNGIQQLLYYATNDWTAKKLAFF